MRQYPTILIALRKRRMQICTESEPGAPCVGAKAKRLRHPSAPPPRLNLTTDVHRAGLDLRYLASTHAADPRNHKKAHPRENGWCTSKAKRECGENNLRLCLILIT